LPDFHFEVKGVQNLNVLAAMKQAIADSSKSGRTPTLAHKKNGEPWLVTMLAADWLKLVKETDRVVSPKAEESTGCHQGQESGALSKGDAQTNDLELAPKSDQLRSDDQAS
jgi:hypothetical protein